MRAEMVGLLNVRLLRDEGGTVQPGTAVVKTDFSEAERPPRPELGELTVRLRAPLAASLAPDARDHVEPGFREDPSGREKLRLLWDGGAVTIREGSRVVLGRPHPGPVPGFVPLHGAGTRINKRQVWIEAGEAGAVIGRLSDANPVEVRGRLVQAGGQIAIETFPAEISLSSGALKLTLDRIPA